MRVLLMPASYPPVLGGVQTVAHRLARHLAAEGHAVRVVTQRYPRTLPAHENRDGIDVRRMLWLTPGWGQLRRGRPDLFLAALLIFPINLFRLFWITRSFRPEVVNVHFPDAQMPFVRALRRWIPFRLVVSLHGHEVLRFAKGDRPGRERLARFLAEADAIMACSGYLMREAEAMVPAMPPRRFVTPNGIDAARFADVTPHTHPRPYLFAFGRLTHKKGFDLLIDAFAGLGDPDHDLLIAGDGEEEARLHAQIAALGLADHVHLVGRLTPAAVVRYLAGCAVAIVPSRVEPFGIAALEALAAGRPLVATDVGGLPTFVGPFVADPSACVALVPPTVAGLQAGLAAVLEGLPRHDGTAVAAAVQSNYDWERRAAVSVEALAPDSHPPAHQI